MKRQLPFVAGLAIFAAMALISVSRADVVGPEPAGWQAPVPAAAFAVLNRGGKPYPAFYRHYIGPHAVLGQGKIWCAYQDGEGRPIVTAYDLKTRRWSPPVRGSEHGLGADTHGNPSLSIDRGGRLHLFFGCHGRKMFHVRSLHPYDASAWQAMPHPVDRATYPQTMRMADGRILLFYRAGGHMEPWSMKISGDDGATWSEAQRIVEMRLEPKDRMAAAYCTFRPGAQGKTVHGFFVHKDDNPTRVDPHPWRPLEYPGLHEAVYRYNVYYIFRDAGGTWRGGDGRELPLPLSKAAADRLALVFDTGHEFARPKRIVVDQENRPYLRFTVGVADWVRGRVIVPHKPRYATSRGGRWLVADEAPRDWPADVRRLINTPGDPVYGTQAPRPWFIFQERGMREDASATYVFLKHVDEGYAVRSGGPAWPPK